MKTLSSATRPPKALPPLGTKLSPLEISEILELVLSYVDEDTLVYGALLVSSLWRSIGQRLVIKTAVLDVHAPKKKRDYVVLEVLPTAKKLVLGGSVRSYLKVSRSEDEERDRLPLVLGQKGPMFSEDDQDKGQGGQKQQQPMGIVPLQEYEVQGSFTSPTLFLAYLPSSQFLTCLKIHNDGRRNRHHFINLPTLFARYPNLAVLDVWALAPGAFVIQVPSQASLPYDPNTLPPSTKLVSLKLINVGIPQGLLQDLLSASPQLKELRLLDLQTYIGPAHMGTVVFSSGFDFDSFINHLRALSLPLRAFALSLDQSLNIMSKEHLEAILDEYGTVREWGFTIQVCKTLALIPNRITDLDMSSWGDARVPTSSSQMIDDEGLHYFLCNAPFLRSLKAKCFFSISRLDHNYTRRGGPGGSTPKWKNWVCKDLEILSLSFGTHFVGAFGNGGLREAGDGRVLFGYLARVLPRLKEFSTWFPNGMPLSLDSGFALLGSMQYLEQVRIEWGSPGHSGPGQPSLSGLWAVIEPTRWSWASNQMALTMWRGELKEEKRDMDQEDKLAGTRTRASLDDSWASTRLLGKLTDVKLALDSMDGELQHGRWWPKLKLLQLQHYEKRGKTTLTRNVVRGQPLTFSDRKKTAGWNAVHAW